MGETHLGDALISAKRCFELAMEDGKGVARISIYHDLLSNCYIELGDCEQATSELRNAIENCTDDKYRGELERRLADLI